MNYATTLLLIFFLIFINAFFAASEIAVISLRRSKLKLLESDKSKQVETVNRLLKNPSQFLATIQIGVTMAGFFASATGAVSLSHNLGRKLEATGLPILGRFGEEIALIAVTLVISTDPGIWRTGSQTDSHEQSRSLIDSVGETLRVFTHCL